jgi:hypothetical protein
MKAFLKDCDQTGVPVNLNYLGEGDHKTVIGGLSSLIALFFIVPFGVLMVIPLFNHNPEFDQQEKISFIEPVNNTYHYNITSEQLLIGTKMSLNNPPANFNFSQYIVPVYLQFKKDIDNNKVGIHSIYSPAVDCLETYG